MSDTLTKKQTQVLNLAKKHDGNVPKIAKAMKITPNGVYGHIRRIRDKGHFVPGHGNGSDDTGNGKVVAPTIDNIVKSVTASVDAEIQDAEAVLAKAEVVENDAGDELKIAKAHLEQATDARLEASDRLGELRAYRSKVAS